MGGTQRWKSSAHPKLKKVTMLERRYGHFVLHVYFVQETSNCWWECQSVPEDGNTDVSYASGWAKSICAAQMAASHAARAARDSKIS